MLLAPGAVEAVRPGLRGPAVSEGRPENSVSPHPRKIRDYSTQRKQTEKLKQPIRKQENLCKDVPFPTPIPFRGKM